jgi:hypothetical protein
MEPCPNCGQSVREGAKFCTSCGYRIAVDDVIAVSTAEQAAPDSAAASSSGDQETVEPVAGWTSADDSQPWERSEWAKPSPDVGVADEPRRSEQAVDELPSVWFGGSTSTWPAPPADASTAPASSSNGQGEATSLRRAATEPASPPSEETPRTEQARERALDLLDELRETIAAIAGGDVGDLNGVIAELEVAVTPPGAIKPDELSELRDALLAAREQPRNLDAIIDLSGRLDAMVALIFAYDRAIAAIERSLEVLRRP